MLTNELAQYFRSIADEPDTTFLTDADVALYLKLGYDEFRQFVTEVAPKTYVNAEIITLTDTDIYDLTQGNVDPTGANTPSLLGPNPNRNAQVLPRMVRLLHIDVVNSSDDIRYRMSLVNSNDELRALGAAALLKSDKLIFSGTHTNTLIKVYYVPIQSIGLAPGVYNPTWTTAINAATFIDDFDAYHDLIALMAYDHYAIRDAAANPLVLQRKEGRKMALREYLERRDVAGPHYVRTAQTPEDENF